MQPICESSGKVIYASRQAARRGIKSGRAHAYHRELDTYRCFHCRLWHNGHPLNFHNHKRFRKPRIQDIAFLTEHDEEILL